MSQTAVWLITGVELQDAVEDLSQSGTPAPPRSRVR
jgi:hypothetical protein